MLKTNLKVLGAIPDFYNVDTVMDASINTYVASLPSTNQKLVSVDAVLDLVKSLQSERDVNFSAKCAYENVIEKVKLL